MTVTMFTFVEILLTSRSCMFQSCSCFVRIRQQRASILKVVEPCFEYGVQDDLVCTVCGRNLNSPEHQAVCQLVCATTLCIDRVLLCYMIVVLRASSSTASRQRLGQNSSGYTYMIRFVARALGGGGYSQSLNLACPACQVTYTVCL